MQEFYDAVRLRFAMIDMKKIQKALTGKKIKEQDLNIHNEIKIITASDDVYDLWSEVISCQSQGELIDPESLMPFKTLKNWTLAESFSSGLETSLRPN